MNVMVNGIPGSMAVEVANCLDPYPDSKERLGLLSVAFSSAQHHDKMRLLGKPICAPVYLIGPAEREQAVRRVREERGSFIAVDYTLPAAVNDNVDFYCRQRIPFVMGTTGGDRSALERRVRDSEIVAVIAPNMATQIVALQAFMEEYARLHSYSLRGGSIAITESHQQKKADTSGTAKAMVDHFGRLGFPCRAAEIRKIRDPEQQRRMGIPEAYLGGHGWHTYHLRTPASTAALEQLAEELRTFLRENPFFSSYTLGEEPQSPFERSTRRVSPDETVVFQMDENPGRELSVTHNVNGRKVYALGTLDALTFLQRKVEAGEKGKVYSMVDVLRAA